MKKYINLFIIVVLLISSGNRLLSQHVIKFNIIEIDEFGRKKPVSQKTGDSIGINKLYYQNYTLKDKGILTIHLPDSNYNQKSVKLIFFNKKSNYTFYDPADGIAQLPLNRNAILTIKVINKKRNQQTRMDSLSFISSLIKDLIDTIKNYDKLSTDEKLSIDNRINEKLVRDLKKNPDLAPYVKSVSQFRKNAWLIKSYSILKPELDILDSLKFNHAYAEAKFLSIHSVTINNLIDSIIQDYNTSHYNSYWVHSLSAVKSLLMNPTNPVSEKIDFNKFHLGVQQFLKRRIGGNVQNNPHISLTSMVGGLDVTNIADGLATFLRDRIIQELINNESLTFFFKASIDSFYISKQTTEVNKINSFRSGIKTDLQNFPDKLIEWINRTAENADSDPYLLSLNNIRKLYMEVSKNSTSRNNIRVDHTPGLFSLLSNNTRDIHKESLKWISNSDFENLGFLGKQLFVTLIKQQNPEVFQELKAINVYFTDQTISPRSLSATDSIHYFYSLFTENMPKYLRILNQVEPEIKKYLEEKDSINYLKIMNNLVLKTYDIFYLSNIKAENFSNLNEFSFKVIKLFLLKNESIELKTIPPIEEIATSALHSKLTRYWTQSKKDSISILIRRIMNIQRTYSMLSGMSTAANPDEFNSIMSAYELPVGSDQHLKTIPKSIYLESFIGINYEMRQQYMYLSPNVSLGLSCNYSFSFSRKPKSLDEFLNNQKYKRLNPVIFAYLNVLNVGNPFSIKVKAPEKETLQRMNFKTMFAPGLSVGFKFANQPISIMTGVNWNTIINLNRKLFYNISCNVGVPIFQLVTRN